MLSANHLKKVSAVLFVVLTLVMSTVLIPVNTAQAYYSGDANQLLLSEPLSEETLSWINLHGAEIEIVDGFPVMVVDGFDEEVYIPFNLPVILDGSFSKRKIRTKYKKHNTVISRISKDISISLRN